MVKEKIDFLLKDLPIMPEIVSLLINELQGEDPDFNRLETIIYRDPFVTTKLISIVNSSFFNLFRKVDNVGEALRFIGSRKLLNIVLMMSLSKSFKDIKDFDIISFWHYSLNVSKLCHDLSTKADIDNNNSLTAGLVHCIGELIIHSKLPDQAMNINSTIPFTSLKRLSTEQKILGFTYLDVSQAFIKKNNFSNLIVNCVKNQSHIKCENNDLDRFDKLSLVLFISIWLVRAKTDYKDIDLNEIDYPEEIIRYLNLDLDYIFNKDESFWVNKEDVAMVI